MKLLPPLLLVLTLLIPQCTTGAATLLVTSTADSGPGTLREALAGASDGDTIDATGVSGIVLLTSGELFVGKSVGIVGPGPAHLAVDGNTLSSVFHIGSNVVVSLTSLTITNGLAADQSGGGIYNDHATLTVSNCVVSGNASGGDVGGGGIANDGSNGSATLTVLNSFVTDNSAPIQNAGGGGIANLGQGGDATVTVVNSFVTGNSAEFEGGGLYNNGFNGSATLVINHCTVTDNQAGAGGGIYNAGIILGSANLTVSNSIIADNLSASGGGLYNAAILGNAPLTLAKTIISGNTATNGSGGGLYNFINGASNAPLTVINSTISGNTATNGPNAGGGVYNFGGGSATLLFLNSTISSNSAPVGGGIYNWATADGGTVALTVSNCIISDNSALPPGINNAGSTGGGIVNEVDSSSGTLTILDSTLIGNSAQIGGGIANRGLGGSATLTVSNCNLSGNSASGGEDGGIYDEGGAIYNVNAYAFGTSSVWIANSTLSSNSARFGGGLANDIQRGNGTLQIANSTLVGNSASDSGGAIYNNLAAMLILIDSTLSDNLATNGSGIFNGINGGTLRIGSTILKAGASGAAIANFGTVISLGYNLSSDDAAGVLTNATDQINTDPLLGPLQDNGGPTFTCALLPGSPAIDLGSNFSGAPNDQRGPGFVRTFDDPSIPNVSGGEGTDIGAFEVQSSVMNPAQVVQHLLVLVNSQANRPQPLRATLTAALASINRNNLTAAINQLTAFQNQVRAQVMPSEPVLAAVLLQEAQDAINGLNAAPP